MSLNHVVVNNNKYDPKLDVRFNRVLVDDFIEFNDGLIYNGQILTQVTNGVNTLYFRDQNGNLIPLAPGGSSRIFQQLAINFFIGPGSPFISLYDISDAIGSLQIPANTIKVGDQFVLVGHGSVTSNASNQICQLQLLLGPVVLLANYNMVIPNLPAGSLYDYRFECLCYEVGGPSFATMKSFGYIHFNDKQGLTHSLYFEETNNISFQTDVTQSFDIEFKWTSTTSGNQLIVHTNSIYKTT